MPFSNLADLKTAVQSWMDRTDISGSADDFVTLAEAGLNRELTALEVDTTLTGTIDSEYISIASLGIETPLDLFMTDYSREWPLLKLRDGDFPKVDTSGKPTIWSYNNEQIMFDRPLGSAYSFRLHHTVKFDLVDDADTNWLLTNHPDIYLCATIAWGAACVADDATRQRFGAPLDAFVASVNQDQRKKNKGTLTVDAGLSLIGRRNYWPWGGFPG
jgi:hypothetical protein